MESTSLDFTGLKIPRDYKNEKEERETAFNRGEETINLVSE